MNSRDKNELRIGVVGAGAAGLTCAHELKKRGWKNVAVLEAQHRPGGRTRTVSVMDPNTQQPVLLERGTLTILESPILRNLLKEIGLGEELIEVPRARYWSPVRGNTYHPFFPPGIAFPLAQKIRESMRYMREIRSARFLEQPGFRGLPGKGLSMPMDAWFHDKGFQFVREAVIPVVCTVLCGNRLDSVPAAYLAKLENIRLRLPMWRNAMLAMQQVRLGNQNIWQRVAQKLDVRFGQAVTDLELEEREIKVWTKANEHIFDRLIWTAGLPRLGKMLAAKRPQSDSRKHYDKVRHLKRAITTYRVEGLPRRIFWAFPDNILRQASGVPYGFISWEGSDIYSFYPWLNSDQNIDALDRATRETVATLGGKVIEQVLETFVMDYHPYFDSSMIEAGVFDDIEREQGRDGIYIAGETVSGITLPAVTEYANDLVTRYF